MKPLLGILLLSILTAACSNKNEGATANSLYMAAVSRPATLNIIDLQTHRVTKKCPLPARMSPGTVIMGPQDKIAYVLADGFSSVYGIDVDNCELRFSTASAEPGVRAKSMASIALSPDGNTLYLHQNPVRLHSDRYQAMDSRVALFDTRQGLNTQAFQYFPAPRQITIMATDAKGTLYLGGPDIFAMDVSTGEIRTALQSRSLNDPRFSPRDVLTVWPVGDTSKEFIRLFSVAKYQDEAKSLDKASWHWGYEKIDLLSGEATSTIFGPLEVVLFSGTTRPGKPNEMWAVLTQLKQFDVAKQSELNSLDLDHTYYCITFSPDGNTLYLSGALSDIAVFDADSLERLATIELDGNMSMATPQIFSR